MVPFVLHIGEDIPHGNAYTVNDNAGVIIKGNVIAIEVELEKDNQCEGQ